MRLLNSKLSYFRLTFTTSVTLEAIINITQLRMSKYDICDINFTYGLIILLCVYSDTFVFHHKYILTGFYVSNETHILLVTEDANLQMSVVSKTSKNLACIARLGRAFVCGTIDPGFEPHQCLHAGRQVSH